MELAGKSEDEIKTEQAKAREGIMALVISTNTTPEGGNIQVALRSPRQIEALKESKEGEWMEPANPDELRATNPLHLLKAAVIPATDTTPEIQPQLNRALGRSFFFGKDKKPIPEFIKIAGSGDIKIAIAKEMMNVLPQHPEKMEAFKQIINSDLFKNHSSWHGAKNAGDALPEPEFDRVVGQNDVVQITLTRKPNEPDPVKTLLDGVIATGKQAETPVPTADEAIQSSFRPLKAGDVGYAAIEAAKKEQAQTQTAGRG